MHAVLEPLAGIYAVNYDLVRKAVGDISEDDLAARPSDDANSMHCVTGHIVSARYFLAGLIGLEDKCPFGDLYVGGVDWKQTVSDPAIEDILSTYEDIAGRITARLDEMTETDLEAKAAQAFPGGDESVRWAIAFLAMHESYHVGQLAYIRKLLGYESLVG